MRKKLLNCFFFLIYILLLLHFLTYIRFLCALQKDIGTKVYITKQLYSIQNGHIGVATYKEPQLDQLTLKKRGTRTDS